MTNPDILCRRETEGATLFNPDTDDWVAINAVGHLIWQALARPSTQQEVVAHVVATCRDAPADQVAVDVPAFLHALLPRGLVGQVLDGGNPLPDLMMTSPPSPLESFPSRIPPEQEPVHSLDLAQDRFYHGHSMGSTFRPGDSLIVEAVPLAAIHPGDVVIYRGRDQAGKASDIVHRVMAVTPGGLVTRGDKNPQVDSGLVTRDDLVGRVPRLVRGGRAHWVWGGRWGLLYAETRRAWGRAGRLCWRLARTVGGRTYRWLRASGLMRQLWRPAITRVLVTADDGLVVKYVHGRRAVAWWQPAVGRFRWRRPYDLIILRPDGRGPIHD